MVAGVVGGVVAGVVAGVETGVLGGVVHDQKTRISHVLECALAISCNTKSCTTHVCYK